MNIIDYIVSHIVEISSPLNLVHGHLFTFLMFVDPHRDGLVMSILVVFARMVVILRFKTFVSRFYSKQCCSLVNFVD